ncbi:F-actin-capping protein subunit alpha-like [Oppia nitens]|uniref:F-actin-capping protein subunit alpha-like n=1 Tax=Oppia nitens TaxID=1686743 RepID=UPI0023DB00B7|nr:F-actin-capping protein subunit alpha-like [Oppia nitens]
MATDLDEPLSDSDKMRIVTDFILHAPPGEFREVVNDVRQLLNNDQLLKEQASSVFAQYSKDQLTAVTIESTQNQTLITEFNEFGSNRYYDPRSRLSFKFDHLREEASDYETWTPDSNSEPWRSALDQLWSKYCADHYHNGVSAVFGLSQSGQISLTACIEDHQFQPKNYWNGRWRSVWSITFSGLGRVEVKGTIKVQVHYYEDGNVQLVSCKDIKKLIDISSETQMAEAIVELVEEAEREYQTAISDNYQTMSDTTFKALRRPLPVTRSKIDWNKIMSYRIGNELKQH